MIDLIHDLPEAFALVDEFFLGLLFAGLGAGVELVGIFKSLADHLDGSLLPVQFEAEAGLKLLQAELQAGGEGNLLEENREDGLVLAEGELNLPVDV